MSSNYQLTLIKQTHQNHYLFSDYYLDKILPTLDYWKDEAGLKEAFDEINKIYLKNLPQLELLKDERRNEEYFIVPVLKVLIPFFEFQPKTLSVERKKRPDYAFFPDEKTKKEAGKKLIREKYNEYFATAIAVGDAKYWDRPLDKKDTKSKDTFTNSNPNYQIDFYLRATNLKWGILTNGRLWRLYNRDTSYKLDNFYQVDLSALIEQNDVEKFKYFYHFFRLHAFVPDARGVTFLDRVYKESISYATEIGDELKNRVYEAMEESAKGFLTFSSNNLTTDRLEEIRENSLILLYRLLFILYAESRKLLPVEEGTSYLKNYSLERIKKEIAGKLDKNEALSSESDIYWNRLKNLFKIINKGDKDLDVPEYNGGLFKPERNEFLEKYDIGDSCLAKVIDLLARTPTKKEKEERFDFVSYRDLEIRHLGSIYEGLLENKLKKADEKLCVIKENKRELVVSANQAKGKKVLGQIEPGEIYLATDKSERKATGSYYTPDYIVKYIVENTLGHLIEDKSPEEILELDVLDPAMGSGHFLIRATEFLAEAIATHPQVKTQVGLDDENELNFWKRQVVERCIYGVDLNPLAVELAKLSLWLATVAKGKPLSFLDHHLRCGNSLIGARLKDLQSLPKKKKKDAPVEQLTFVQEEWFKQDVWHFLKLFKEIEQKESISKKAIDEKYVLLQTLERAREKYKKIADLWTSGYFGNAIDSTIYLAAVDGLRDEKQKRLSEKIHRKIFEEAERLAKDKHFFHWELEFPEIFFDEYGREKDNPGFDTVIGNPPYGSKKMLDIEGKKFIKVRIQCTGSNDITEMFISKVFDILCQDGQFGFIVPKPLTYITSWSQIRNFLSSKKVRIVVDVSKAFEDVLLEQVILICQNSDYEDLDVRTGFVQNKIIMDQRYFPAKNISERIIPFIATNDLQPFLKKIAKTSVNLAEVTKIWAGIGGITKYLNRKEGVKCIRGDDIDRYCFSKDDFELLPKKYVSQTDIEEHSQPRIICQDIIAHIEFPFPHIKLTAHLDKCGNITHETIINFSLIDQKSEYSLVYILSLINSTFISWYAYHFIFNCAIRTMHYRPGYADYTPIRRISFNTAPPQRQILMVNLKNEYREVMKETEITAFSSFLGFRNSEIGKIIHECLSSKPEKSDVIHDFLAFLAEQMMELNKEKQKEIKTFLKWLCGEIKANIEDMSLKTKIKDYHKADFDSLWQALKKNEKKIQVSLSHSYMGKLEEEYNLSMEKLSPLKAKIQGTDKLIDQLVYQLYGLTEEEIKIVEG